MLNFMMKVEDNNELMEEILKKNDISNKEVAKQFSVSLNDIYMSYLSFENNESFNSEAMSQSMLDNMNSFFVDNLNSINNLKGEDGINSLINNNMSSFMINMLLELYPSKEALYIYIKAMINSNNNNEVITLLNSILKHHNDNREELVFDVFQELTEDDLKIHLNSSDFLKTLIYLIDNLLNNGKSIKIIEDTIEKLFILNFDKEEEILKAFALSKMYNDFILKLIKNSLADTTALFQYHDGFYIYSYNNNYVHFINNSEFYNMENKDDDKKKLVKKNIEDIDNIKIYQLEVDEIENLYLLNSITNINNLNYKCVTKAINSLIFDDNSKLLVNPCDIDGIYRDILTMKDALISYQYMNKNNYIKLLMLEKIDLSDILDLYIISKKNNLTELKDFLYEYKLIELIKEDLVLIEGMF